MTCTIRGRGAGILNWEKMLKQEAPRPFENEKASQAICREWRAIKGVFGRGGPKNQGTSACPGGLTGKDKRTVISAGSRMSGVQICLLLVLIVIDLVLQPESTRW